MISYVLKINQGGIGRVFGKKIAAIKLILKITELCVKPDRIWTLPKIFLCSFSCHFTTFFQPPTELSGWVEFLCFPLHYPSCLSVEGPHTFWTLQCCARVSPGTREPDPLAKIFQNRTRNRQNIWVSSRTGTGTAKGSGSVPKPELFWNVSSHLKK